MQNERCGFRCTGYDGSSIWTELHKLPEKIDCQECSEHAAMLFKGLHDHVNAGLGHPVYDKHNYSKFADEVACVYAACKREGRC